MHAKADTNNRLDNNSATEIGHHLIFTRTFIHIGYCRRFRHRVTLLSVSPQLLASDAKHAAHVENAA